MQVPYLQAPSGRTQLCTERGSDQMGNPGVEELSLTQPVLWGFNGRRFKKKKKKVL